MTSPFRSSASWLDWIARPWPGAALLLAATLLAYANSFRVPFQMDDFRSVVENPTLAEPAKWFSPPTSAGVGGRPLLNASFGLNYAAGGLSPLGYHAVNFVVHAACALLLAGLVGRTAAGRGWSETSARLLGFAAAAAWALHPVQTTAVTYVSQRAETLAALCVLACLYAFRRSVGSPRALAWGVVAAVAGWAGIAVKETAMTAPLLVLLYDRAFVSGSWRDGWRRHGRLYLALFAGWLPLAWLMTSSEVMSRVGLAPTLPAGAGALVMCGAIAHYARLAVWPAGLVFDYGNIYEMGPFATWPGAVVTALLLGAVVFAVMLGRRATAFLGAAFFLLLLPTTSLIPVAGQPIAEHRLYLPLACVSIGLAAGVFHVLGRRGLAALASIAVVAGFAAGARNRDYRSAEALWRATLARVPDNPRANDWLAVTLAGSGRFEEALAVVRRALGVRPRDDALHFTHAKLLQQKGESGQALLAARMAVELAPENRSAHVFLFRLYGQRGELENARRHLEAALRLDPNDGPTCADFSYVLRELGRRDEALRYGEAAVRLAPGYEGSHANLALALIDHGRLAEAAKHHRAWLALQPPDAPANFTIVDALRARGAAAEARAELEAIVRRHPRDERARAQLAAMAAP